MDHDWRSAQVYSLINPFQINSVMRSWRRLLCKTRMVRSCTLRWSPTYTTLYTSRVNQESLNGQHDCNQHAGNFFRARQPDERGRGKCLHGSLATPRQVGAASASNPGDFGTLDHRSEE